MTASLRHARSLSAAGSHHLNACRTHKYYMARDICPGISPKHGLRVQMSLEGTRNRAHQHALGRCHVHVDVVLAVANEH